MLRVASVFALSLVISTPLAGEVSPTTNFATGPRGVIVPTEQATLAIEFAAVVRKIHFREGQFFAKGDRLIEFDCRRQQAEFQSAKAQHQEMLLTLESNVYLAGRGALGKHETEISKTRAQKAAAEAQALKLRLEQCQIDAPFDGSVADLSIYEHEMPAPGKPFLKIIKSGADVYEGLIVGIVVVFAVAFGQIRQSVGRSQDSFRCAGHAPSSSSRHIGSVRRVTAPGDVGSSLLRAPARAGRPAPAPSRSEP